MAQAERLPQFTPSYMRPVPRSYLPNITPPAPSFHAFCMLPAELRFRIYEYAIEPRVVELETSRQSLPPYSLFLHSRTSIPSLLHVWRESREFMSVHYELAFATKPRSNEACPVSPACVFVCFDIDTIYINPSTFDRLFNIYLMMRTDRERIQHLAVDSLCLDYLKAPTFPAVRSFAHVLHSIPYVKDVSLTPFDKNNQFVQNTSRQWQQSWRHNWQSQDLDKLPDWMICRYKCEPIMTSDAKLPMYGFNAELLHGIDRSYPLYKLYQ
jgi:hypothetical protein